MKIEQNVNFSDNKSWSYERRVVNLANFTISYEQVSGIPTEEEALRLREADDTKYQKDLNRIKKIANAQYTFGEFLRYWLDNIFLPETDTSSAVLATWAINAFILPRITYDILLPYVTSNYVNDIIKCCSDLNRTSGNVASKYMRRIFRDAYAYGFVKKDIRNELLYIEYKNSQLENIQLLTKKQLAAFLKVASLYPQVYLEILLALFAGLRTGEIRGLRYEDFDEKNQTLHIQRQYTTLFEVDPETYQTKRKQGFSLPKAKSCRTLKIPQFIFDELKNKKRLNENFIASAKKKKQPYDDGYVSLSSTGKIKNDGAILHWVRKICLEASVPVIKTHTLRHQFASMLLEKGVPLEQISHLLGHKSTITTFEVYCGIMDAAEDTRDVISTFAPYKKEV